MARVRVEKGGTRRATFALTKCYGAFGGVEVVVDPDGRVAPVLPGALLPIAEPLVAPEVPAPLPVVLLPIDRVEPVAPVPLPLIEPVPLPLIEPVPLPLIELVPLPLEPPLIELVPPVVLPELAPDALPLALCDFDLDFFDFLCLVVLCAPLAAALAEPVVLFAAALLPDGVDVLAAAPVPLVDAVPPPLVVADPLVPVPVVALAPPVPLLVPAVCASATAAKHVSVPAIRR